MKNPARLRAAFDRVPVGRQLYGAFALVIVLTAVLGALSLFSLQQVRVQAEALATKWMVGIGHLAEVRSLVVESRDLEVKHSRTGDKSYHAEYEDKLAEVAKAAGERLAAYEKLLDGDAERKLFGDFGKSFASLRGMQKKVIELGRGGQQQDAADISDGGSAMAFDESVGALSKLMKFSFEGGEAAAQQAKAVYERSLWTVAGLLVAALVLGAGLAVAITRNLLGQLGGEPRAAVSVAKAVSEGDLTTPIRLKSGDTRSLLANLHAMQQSLADAVSNVRRGSEFVATASTQIAQGNQDLSGRTEQQASALQETAATMDELGSTVRTNADNAGQASQLAQGASAVARKGGDVVGQVVQTMKGINDSSRKIADIIGVIDSIAFQTNILALNAAVEAARAGEQGRGFAVVAGEVRSLAQRSAAAAKEIKELIGASVERVEQGSQLVDTAGTTMEEIVAAIRRVSDIVSEISAASSEQSRSVEQVGTAVSRMDQSTQQNAALVEESAAAAESLKQQAQQLVQSVAVFKLAGAH